ncbi:MAG: hypothetical protein OXC62_04915 [Aestuariivita sp.]|nr:hypothetical protein [Aestuariivita sp.]
MSNRSNIALNSPVGILASTFIGMFLRKRATLNMTASKDAAFCSNPFPPSGLSYEWIYQTLLGRDAYFGCSFQDRSHLQPA